MEQTGGRELAKRQANRDKAPVGLEPIFQEFNSQHPLAWLFGTRAQFLTLILFIERGRAAPTSSPSPGSLLQYSLLSSPLLPNSQGSDLFLALSVLLSENTVPDEKVHIRSLKGSFDMEFCIIRSSMIVRSGFNFFREAKKAKGLVGRQLLGKYLFCPYVWDILNFCPRHYLLPLQLRVTITDS